MELLKQGIFNFTCLNKDQVCLLAFVWSNLISKILHTFGDRIELMVYHIILLCKFDDTKINW